MKTVDLIVPCYNESEVLSLFYDELRRTVLDVCTDYETHVIFINDGSRDNTLDIITNLAKTDDRIKYISFSRNFGKESAMLAGLNYANADFIGILDADLQHSPSMLIEMIKSIDGDEYDIAAARRTDRSGEGKVKSSFSRRFYKVINKMSDVDIAEGAQDFRVMKNKVVKAILSMPEYNRFSKGIFSWVGFRTKWFEHINVERAAGKTKFSFFKLTKYAIDGIISFSTAPLRMAMIFGIICSSFGMIYGLFILIRTLFLGTDVAGYPSIICLVTFIGGIILVSLGIVGEYIARIFLEVKGRPGYIIDRTNIDPR